MAVIKCWNCGKETTNTLERCPFCKKQIIIKNLKLDDLVKMEKFFRWFAIILSHVICIAFNIVAIVFVSVTFFVLAVVIPLIILLNAFVIDSIIYGLQENHKQINEFINDFYIMQKSVKSQIEKGEPSV